jgi:SSS family solute:Na+ symporter
VPPGWSELTPGWNLGINWEGIIPEVNRKIDEDGFNPFGMFFSLMAAKGILASLAGPAPTYDMQKVLSTGSPREAALMSMFVNVVLLPTRYLMIIGFTVLGLLYYDELNLQTVSGAIDFERILPSTILKFAPAGLMGLFLVELMSAFMGTFAGTLNAAQAYIVNDVYLKSINKNPSNAQLNRMNYLSGIVVVIISIILGIFAKDVNSILQWIVGALFGAYVTSNVLKWHWWRFNGTGFFFGMLLGIIAALILPYVFTDTLPLYYFPIILLLSFVGCIGGSLFTAPTDMAVLKSFYSTVRPWGFWGPVLEEVKKDNSTFKENKDFKKDMFNVVVGIVAQTSITVLPVYIVLLMPKEGILTAVILLVCVLTLYKTWFKKLPED